MKSKVFLFVFLGLFLWGCKSDKPDDNQEDNNKRL